MKTSICGTVALMVAWIRSSRYRMVVGFITKCAIKCLSPLMLWVRIPLRRCVLDTTLCDKDYQWLAKGRWYSPGTSVSSTNKTDRHDITEILLKVALNKPYPPFLWSFFFYHIWSHKKAITGTIPQLVKVIYTYIRLRVSDCCLTPNEPVDYSDSQPISS